MKTVVEELKEKYGENTEKFSIALMMEIFDRFGEKVATDYINRKYENLSFKVI